MGTRLELQDILLSLLEKPRDEEADPEEEEPVVEYYGGVYFQPPESLKIDYPCIVYKRDKIDAKYANDAKYVDSIRYQVTVIDRNPDSLFPSLVNSLPKCTHQRQYASNGLYHDVFELYH